MRLLIAVCCFFSVALASASPAAEAPDIAILIEAAQRAMEAEQYGKALELYQQARQQRPDSPQIPFNMGVAAYRNGDLDKAAELFNQVRLLADDAALRARSAYNLGTTAYRKTLQQPDDPAQAATHLEDATAELAEALGHFREAIDADPADLDARANGELAHRWLQELERMKQQLQQQQQQQPQQDRNRESSEQPQDRQQPPSGEQQEQPEAGQQEEEQQAGQQPDEEQREGQAAQAQQEQLEDERQDADARKPMSREEAERLLQRVRDKERRRREELARREASRRPPVDRDW